MQLGKKSTSNNDILNTIKAEEGIPDQPLSVSLASHHSGGTPQQQAAASPLNAALSPKEG
jgi:hypothetical protein